MGKSYKRRKTEFEGDVFGRGTKALQMDEANSPPENIAATGGVVREHGELGSRPCVHRRRKMFAFCLLFFQEMVFLFEGHSLRAIRFAKNGMGTLS